MAHRSAAWFRMVATGAALISLLMVPAIVGLELAHLPLWLHIPLMAVVLGLLSVGAMATGVAFVEYRSRLPGNREEPQ